VNDVRVVLDTYLEPGKNIVLVHAPSRADDEVDYMVNVEGEERFYIEGLVEGSNTALFVSIYVPEEPCLLRANDIIAQTRTLSSLASDFSLPSILTMTTGNIKGKTRTPVSDIQDIRQLQDAALNVKLPYALPDDDPNYSPDYSDYVPPTETELKDQLENFKATGVTEKELSELQKVLIAYGPVFDDKLRTAGPATVRLDTHEVTPFNRSFAPKDPRKLELLKGFVQEMLEQGILVPVTSPYSSPSFVIPKPGQKERWRFVTDFRMLNSVTTKTRADPPPVEACLYALKGKPLRSQIDLRSAFWQLGIYPPHIQKTATLIPGLGLFGYKRLPMGAKNSMASMQSQLSRIFANELFDSVIVWADDIIVYSSTADEHVKHLTRVFQILYKYGHTINLSKSHFFTHKVNYLGFEIVGDAIRPQRKFLVGLENLEPPKSFREVQAALGLFNYLRRFIPRYAAKVIPLQRLLRTTSRQAFALTCDAQQAFDDVRKELVALFSKGDPLYLPDKEKTLYLASDASARAIGGFVYQLEDESRRHLPDNIRPIAFVSRCLQAAEEKYADILIAGRTGFMSALTEPLAAIYLLETMADLIEYCKDAVLVTDHRNLEFLRNRTRGMLFRWGLRIMQFGHVRIRHSSKGVITVADCLSRLTLSPSSSLRSETGTENTRTITHLYDDKKSVEEDGQVDEDGYKLVNTGKKHVKGIGMKCLTIGDMEKISENDDTLSKEASLRRDNNPPEHSQENAMDTEKEGCSKRNTHEKGEHVAAKENQKKKRARVSRIEQGKTEDAVCVPVTERAGGQLSQHDKGKRLSLVRSKKGGAEPTLEDPPQMESLPDEREADALSTGRRLAEGQWGCSPRGLQVLRGEPRCETTSLGDRHGRVSPEADAAQSVLLGNVPEVLKQHGYVPAPSSPIGDKNSAQRGKLPETGPQEIVSLVKTATKENIVETYLDTIDGADDQEALVTLEDVFLSQQKYCGGLVEALKRGFKTATKKYELINNIVYHLPGTFQDRATPYYVETKVLVVPNADEDLQTRIVRSMHRSHPYLGAHAGPKQTELQVRARYHWRGISALVREITATCGVCRLAKSTSRKRQGYLQHYLRNVDNDAVAYDHVILRKKHRSGDREVGIAVITDYYSQYTVAYPLKSLEHTYLLARFEECYLCIYGTPRILIADSELESHIFCGFLGLLETRLSIITSYNSQSNPVERVNRRVEECIRTFLLELDNKESAVRAEVVQHKDYRWAYVLPHMCAVLNNHPIAKTKITPFEVRFGTKYRSPHDLLLDLPLDDGVMPSLNEYVKGKKELVTAIAKQVKIALRESRIASVIEANRARIRVTLEEGDTVYRYVPLRQEKLAPKALGPYLVLEQISPVLYRIQHMRDESEVTAHVNQLVRVAKGVHKPGHVPFSAPSVAGEQDLGGQLIVWKYKKANEHWEQEDVFIHLVLQHTSDGKLLMQHYADKRQQREDDFNLPVRQRQLAPQYYKDEQRRLVTCTWRPGFDDLPTCEWETLDMMRILASFPKNALREDGWSDEASRTLRRLRL